MPSTASNPAPPPAQTGFGALRRFAQRRPEHPQCEFCCQDLPVQHRHVLETTTRKIVCACTPCALRFESVTGKWKLIPRDSRRLDAFVMSDSQWEALALPINLVFLFHSTPASKVVALYPSPAGATESLLPLASWEALAAQNPVLAQMQPDVQALLVHRLKECREYFLAPIDRCFELVGLIRLHWRGLSGGEQAWSAIDKFFQELREFSGTM